MGKKISLILILAIAAFVFAGSAMADEAKSDNGKMVILRGDQLTQSITKFDKGEFGPIKVIVKLYDGNSRAPGYRVYFNMYGNIPDIDDMAELSKSKHKYFIPISIWDDYKPLENSELLDSLSADKPAVFDSNFIECSMQKFMLINRDKTIYLVAAYKDTTDASAATHTMKAYKLVAEPGAYFLKVAEGKTTSEVCSPKDVYEQMTVFVKSTLK